MQVRASPVELECNHVAAARELYRFQIVDKPALARPRPIQDHAVDPYAKLFQNGPGRRLTEVPAAEHGDPNRLGMDATFPRRVRRGRVGQQDAQLQARHVLRHRVWGSPVADRVIRNLQEDIRLVIRIVRDP